MRWLFPGITMRYVSLALEITALISFTSLLALSASSSAHAAAPRYLVGNSEVSVGQAITASLAGSEVYACKAVVVAVSKSGSGVSLKAVKAVRK